LYLRHLPQTQSNTYQNANQDSDACLWCGRLFLSEQTLLFRPGIDLFQRHVQKDFNSYPRVYFSCRRRLYNKAMLFRFKMYLWSLQGSIANTQVYHYPHQDTVTDTIHRMLRF